MCFYGSTHSYDAASALSSYTHPIIGSVETLNNETEDNQRGVYTLAHEIGHLYGITSHQHSSAGELCVMNSTYESLFENSGNNWFCPTCAGSIGNNFDRY